MTRVPAKPGISEHRATERTIHPPSPGRILPFRNGKDPFVSKGVSSTTLSQEIQIRINTGAGDDGILSASDQDAVDSGRFRELTATADKRKPSRSVILRLHSALPCA